MDVNEVSFYLWLSICCQESSHCPGPLPSSEEPKEPVTPGQGLLLPEGGEMGRVSILLGFQLRARRGKGSFSGLFSSRRQTPHVMLSVCHRSLNCRRTRGLSFCAEARDGSGTSGLALPGSAAWVQCTAEPWPAAATPAPSKGRPVQESCIFLASGMFSRKLCSLRRDSRSSSLFLLP